MDKSAEGGLRSIGNTMRVRKNPPENREHLQKFPLNLKLLYATGPRLSKPQIGVHYWLKHLERNSAHYILHPTDDMWLGKGITTFQPTET